MSRGRRALVLAPLLAACASPQPVRTLARTPARTSAEPVPQPGAGGRRWRLDATASRLRAVVFRDGAMARRVGHHHILEAGAAEGWLWLPDEGLDGAAGEIALPLDALRIDEPAWRREAGGEFDEKPLEPEAIAATRRNLLASLQAEAHPQLRLQLLQLGGAAPWWTARLRVQLAGGQAEQSVALAVQRTPERLRLQARVALSQRALGLTPFSVLGGLLAVADALVLEGELVWV